MAYITIKQFADKHGVTRQAVEYALEKKIKVRFGIKVINENTEYTPVLGRGRKPAKKKGKKND